MADERTHARAFFECTCIFFCTRVGADKCKQIRCGVRRPRRWSFVAVDVAASWRNERIGVPGRSPGYDVHPDPGGRRGGVIDES